MDMEEDLCESNWGNSSSSGTKLPKSVSSEDTAFIGIMSQQNEQKWEDPSILDYSMRIEQPFQDFDQLKAPVLENSQENEAFRDSKTQDWDPRAMLSNLSFLEEKIHQLQDLVHLIVGRRGQVLGRPDELVAQQQQLITADLTSIIVQLISTAGTLLPSVKQHNLSAASQYSGLVGQVGEGVAFSAGRHPNSVAPSMQNTGGIQDPDFPKSLVVPDNCKTDEKDNFTVDEHELKDEDDVEEGENLPPGSYEILQLEKEEILAPHTHFCTICGKGFKRDANLRMHMRGHGDEYKSPAALAKPHKESGSEPILIKRYSCPYPGCKRNKEHKKFQPLKTILCVKNHYKRTHCDKSFICSRCHTKKFSVLADLKTHEKHCGKNKWLCSCGTTFSRKDKLFGHIALFQGHTPAIPLEESKMAAVTSGNEASNKTETISFNFAANASTSNAVQMDIMDEKGGFNDPAGCFSPLNFDTCNFSSFHEFPRPTFDDDDNPFSLLIAGSCNFSPKNGEQILNNL